jgi:hypothetical protein
LRLDGEAWILREATGLFIVDADKVSTFPGLTNVDVAEKEVKSPV